MARKHADRAAKKSHGPANKERLAKQQQIAEVRPRRADCIPRHRQQQARRPSAIRHQPCQAGCLCQCAQVVETSCWFLGNGLTLARRAQKKILVQSLFDKFDTDFSKNLDFEGAPASPFCMVQGRLCGQAGVLCWVGEGGGSRSRWLGLLGMAEAKCPLVGRKHLSVSECATDCVARPEMKNFLQEYSVTRAQNEAEAKAKAEVTCLLLCVLLSQRSDRSRAAE